jgi:hypothetical protein
MKMPRGGPHLGDVFLSGVNARASPGLSEGASSCAPRGYLRSRAGGVGLAETLRDAYPSLAVRAE